MFLLYNCLLTVLAPVWVVWMLLRARARKEAPNWAERQGQYALTPRKDRQRIWIHAVSVGEVVAAMPVLAELRKQLPKHEIVLSVTTSSGHATAREKASAFYDHLVYAPIDVARFTLGAMQRLQPSVLAIMETELWMNLLWAAKTFDVQTVLINGRISDRSFRRSKKIAFFYRSLFRKMDRLLMQSEGDAERVRALGADQQKVEVLGNCKFDQALEGLDADPSQWRRELCISDESRVIVVGSIRAEEFEFLAQAVAKVENAIWVIAPRHLERISELEKGLSSVGTTTGVVRRSNYSAGTAEETMGGKPMPRIILLDTYGELSQVYSVADVAIVGGGFAKLGGQNILQPLAHGKPVLHGPHMANFRDVAAMSVTAGASWVCTDPQALATAIKQLLENDMMRAEMGRAASELVRANVGASRRYAEAIAMAASTRQAKS